MKKTDKTNYPFFNYIFTVYNIKASSNPEHSQAAYSIRAFPVIVNNINIRRYLI